MKKNLFGMIRNIFATANTETTNTAAAEVQTEGRESVTITADEALAQLAAQQGAEPTPAAALTPDQVSAKLDAQFAERLENARGKKATEIEKRSKEATERAASWQKEATEATTAGKTEKADRAADVAARWQKLAGQLATLAAETAAKEREAAKAAARAEKEETARLAALTPEEIAANPEDAQKVAEAARKEATAAKKVAQEAKQEAATKEAEANKAEVVAAKARKSAGESTQEDEVVITRQQLADADGDTAALVVARVKEMKKEGRTIFGEILNEEYNLSKVIKRAKSADQWPNVAKYLDLCGVSIAREELTPAIFSEEHAHVFMLVATGGGYKVGTITSRGTQVVKRWSLETLLNYILTDKALKEIATDPAKLAARRAALAAHEAALKAVKEAETEAEQKKQETEAARQELAAAQDPNAPEVTAAELEQKQDAAKEAEAREAAAKEATKEAKQEAREAAKDVADTKTTEEREAQKAAATNAANVDKYGAIPAEIARKAMKAAKDAQRRAVKKATEAGNEAAAARLKTAEALTALFIERVAKAQSITTEAAAAQLAAA